MKRFTLMGLMLFLFGIASYAQTFFTDDFNAGTIGTGWVGSGAYALTQSGGSLKVGVRTTQPNQIFTLNLGSQIDISSKPFLNLKLKGEWVYSITVSLVDASNARVSQYARVPVASDNFVNYCFDFSAGTLDRTKVTKIEIAINASSNSYSGDVYFEDLQLGTSSAKIAGLSPAQDVTVYTGKVAQKILVTDIKNASAIAISGAGALMTGITYSAMSGGVCTITYTAGTPGSAVITVTATGTGGFSDNTSQFTLTVEDNIVPTIDQAPDAKLAVGKAQTIKLTGITDGNISLDQPLTVTASSSVPATIPNPSVTYQSGSPYATLTVNPAIAGTADITVTVKDDGAANNTKTMTFKITSYAGFNYAPTINVPANPSMYLSAGTLKVKLTGIGSGDAAAQTLTITPTGKHASVISTITPAYTQGQDTAILTLTAAGLGKDTITVTVTDNGNNGTNNGNQTTTVSFVVEVLQAPPTGYKVTMNAFLADTTAKLWTIEGNDVTQKCSYVDTLGMRWIKIVITAKSNWAGLWYNLPKEVDVSKAPYMSYQIMAKGFSPLQTHCYFWDVDSQRNGDGAHNQRDTISVNPQNPHTVFMDFRAAKDQFNSAGVPINMSRIDLLLFNYHDKFLWPNNVISGVVYISDIRMGDSCKGVPVINPACTMNPVATQVTWAGGGQQSIQISGLSDGKGSTSGLTITTLSSKSTLFPAPVASSVSTDGKATLTYTPAATADSSQFIIRVNATGSTQKEIRFWVKTLLDNANLVTLTVDATTKGQTMTGFGAHSPNEMHLENFAKDQGCNIIRFFYSGNNIERQNDNSDPNQFNRDGFPIQNNEIDFDYIRKAAAAGVTDFFVTVLAPPNWMFQGLTDATKEGAPSWGSTTEKVDPIYYEEYAEFMFGIVRLIKEETGVELTSICPQNEPCFTEPYGSGILDPIHMAQVCGMVGKKLHDAGYSTQAMTAEQVFTQPINSVVQYANAVKADSLANLYTNIVGMHYPDVNPTAWAVQYAACKNGTSYPKMYWGTECRSGGNLFDKIMEEAHEITVGLNNGLSGWVVLGYSQSGGGDDNDPKFKEGMMVGSTQLKHYYAYKNFAKFIRKGAVQLKTTVSGGANLYAASFNHEKDSTMTIVIVNRDTKMPYAFKLGGSAPATGWDVYRSSQFERCEKVDAFKGGVFMVPPKSITTLYIKTNVNHAPTIDQVAEKFVAKNGSGTASLTGITCGDPENQTITITATSDNPSVIANPVPVTYTSPALTGSIAISPVANVGGVVNIRVLVKDNGGIAKGGVDTTVMTFKVTIPTALNDVSDQATVYPNPADEKVNVLLPAGMINASLAVTNMSGQALITSRTTSDNVELNVSALPAGTYVITVNNDKDIVKLNFVKK